MKRDEKKPKVVRHAQVFEGGPASLLDRQKNKVRGIIGSTKKHHADAYDKPLRLRTAVRKALAESRYELPREYRDEFMRWLGRAGAEATASLPELASRGLINEVVQSRRTSLKEELEWALVLLSQSRDSITAFIKLSRALDVAFWSGHRDECRALLKQIREQTGESVWLINAEIALRQAYDGLESQKAFASSIQKMHRGGLPGYLAFFISVRNEERSTYHIFDEDFKEHLEKTKLSSSFKSFFLYKLVGTLPIVDSTIADIIHLESSSSFVDLYETVIDVLQRCVGSMRAGDWKQAAISLLSEINPGNDPRLSKLLTSLGHAPAHESDETQAQESRQHFKDNVATNFWASVWPMMFIKRLPDSDSEGSQESRSLEELLASLISRDEGFEDSRVALAKFTRNFGFLRTARAAGDFADFLTLRVRNQPSSLARPLLNSDAVGAYEAFLDAETMLHPSSPSRVDNDRLFSRDSGQPRGFKLYLEALKIAQTDRSSALSILNDIDRDGLPTGLVSLIRNLSIQINLEEGESDEAIRAIGSDVASTPSIINAVPASAAIGDRSWDSLSATEDKIALAITLYALWKQTDDSLRTTHLRFAFEDGLMSLGVEFASEIRHELIASDNMIRFFVTNICIPVLMDTSGLFSTTEDLLDERLKLLTKLAKANPSNIDDYEHEAATIRASKLIKSGLAIVDSNRVAVDAGAITRWAIKRYRESYNRYQALRAAGVGTSEKFDILLDRIKADPDQNAEHFTVPENEADSLLLGIMLAIRDRFLHDEQYGLEYFLGKRIRHGTISGHMRGPAENAKLISERPSPGRPYELNVTWMPTLTFRTPDCERATENAFAQFSESYDKLIADARDRFLHVNSSNHNEGLLSLIIDAFRYHLVRSVVRPGLEFEDFVEALFTLLWSLLDPSLHLARTYLTETVKAEVIQLYARLQEEVRANVIQDDGANKLLATIQSTSTMVQRELDTVGDWFIRGDSQQVTHMFAMEDVLEVSIQSALKSLPNFGPLITKTVSGIGRTTSAVLVTLSDIVFIVFDNIHRRARVGARPGVVINFGLSEANDCLSIRIENAIASDTDRLLLDNKLARIREKIANDDLVKGAFVEGESGLLKIAAHARHYPKSRFAFGVEGDHFFTEVVFPVVYVIDRFSLAPPEDDQ